MNAYGDDGMAIKSKYSITESNLGNDSNHLGDLPSSLASSGSEIIRINMERRNYVLDGHHDTTGYISGDVSRSDDYEEVGDAQSFVVEGDDFVVTSDCLDESSHSGSASAVYHKNDQNRTSNNHPLSSSSSFSSGSSSIDTAEIRLDIILYVSEELRNLVENETFQSSQPLLSESLSLSQSRPYSEPDPR